MIKQITLYNHDYGLSDNESGDNSRTWFFCMSAIREYFDLPSDCNRVTFTVYGQSDVDRVKFEFTMSSNLIGVTYPRILVDGRPRYDFQTLTKDAILKLFQKHGTFYVGCEYK